jgi:hypothetical protein
MDSMEFGRLGFSVAARNKPAHPDLKSLHDAMFIASFSEPLSFRSRKKERERGKVLLPFVGVLLLLHVATLQQGPHHEDLDGLDDLST